MKCRECKEKEAKYIVIETVTGLCEDCIFDELEDKAQRAMWAGQAAGLLVKQQQEKLDE